ncbi:CZB domain-containing protein [Magnetovibrio sp.]|uniref:CZB domain-containing protein n=1 Tax=Magnetovibrio sp. TaxID=2024836 RepID=UPI002F932DF0
MDFSQITHMHISWLQDILSNIQNPARLDPDQIARDDACELGKWINSVDARYRHLPEYAELDTVHRELHQAASDAVVLAQAGKIKESRECLSIDGSCVETSKRVLDCAARLLAKMNA